MKLKAIACEVFARTLYQSAARSRNVVDIELIRKALHERPDELRKELQARVETAALSGYDAVVLAYGLCGKATEGLVAVRIPLILPKAHDCITLFLGSRDRYRREFDKEPGTFWFVEDFMERDHGSPWYAAGLGSESSLQTVYEEYVEKYGKDNADYLMEVMGAWRQHYRRAAFIDLGLGTGNDVRGLALERARQHGWAFEAIAAELGLLQRLVDGPWERDFLVVQPGESVGAAGDDDIVRIRA